MSIAKRVLNNMKSSAADLLLSDMMHGDDALELDRMSTCNRCEKYDSENSRCRVCGCFMTVKTKLTTNSNPSKYMRTEFTHCPEGRWGDLHIANYYRTVDGLPLLAN